MGYEEDEEFDHVASGDIHDNDLDPDLVPLRDPKFIDNLSREKCEEHLQHVSKIGHHELFLPLLHRCAKVPSSVLINLLANAEETPDGNVDYRKCLGYVLSEGVICDVNRPDSGLDTPLHYSVRYADPDSTLCLLKKGASLGNKNRLGNAPIQEIDFETLEAHFDTCIETKYAGINKIVIFDYRTIIPSPSPKRDRKVFFGAPASDLVSESTVISSMAKIPELWPLLMHPLISSFLFIKWYKIRKYFYAQLILYIIFYASLLTFIFLSYHENARNDFRDLSFLIPAIPVVISSAMEVIQIFTCPRRYFLHFENVLQLLLSVLSLIIIFEESPSAEEVSALAASAIMLGAFKMMILLGRHPMMSTSVAMFYTVSCNFFKAFVSYTVLLLAFALTFYKLHDVTGSDEKEDGSTEYMFGKVHLSIIKTIIMLAGELDAGVINFELATNTVVFIMFVFLITIILLNLLQGIAVCDTQQLKADSEKIGIIKRIEYSVYMEDLIFGNVMRNMQHCLARVINVSSDFLEDYKMEVYINVGGKIRNVGGRRGRVFLDGNTIKRVKHLLEERRKGEKVDEIERLKGVITEKDELINNLMSRIDG